MLTLVRGAYERLLEAVVILLMAATAIEVTAGIVFRTLGRSLSWYDEVASILLAWLTFYGAALAAIKGAHIGFPNIVAGMAPRWRVTCVLVAEALVLGFFVVLGWLGYTILEVVASSTLVSIPEISVAWAQSVIPVSSVLFIVAELLHVPSRLAAARAGSGGGEAGIAERLH